MNARKSIYNILSGLLGQGIAILLGIMIPRLVIVNLGSESNGLLSSVNQMLIYLNLLESGVGNRQHCSPFTARWLKKIYQKLTAFYLPSTVFTKESVSAYLLTVSALALLFPLFLQSDLPFSVICPVVLLSGLTQAASFCCMRHLPPADTGRRPELCSEQCTDICLCLHCHRKNCPASSGISSGGHTDHVLCRQFISVCIHPVLYEKAASVAEFFCGAESWGFVTEAFGFDPSDLRSDFPEYGRPDPDICLRIKNSQRLHYVCHAFRHDCHSHFNCQ